MGLHVLACKKCGAVVRLHVVMPPVRCSCGNTIPTTYPYKPKQKPGSTIRNWLKALGVKEKGNCGCQSLASQMNRLGVRGTFDNLLTLSRDLSKNAARRWPRLSKWVPFQVLAALLILAALVRCHKDK